MKPRPRNHSLGLQATTGPSAGCQSCRGLLAAGEGNLSCGPCHYCPAFTASPPFPYCVGPSNPPQSHRTPQGPPSPSGPLREPPDPLWSPPSPSQPPQDPSHRPPRHHGNGALAPLPTAAPSRASPTPPGDAEAAPPASPRRPGSGRARGGAHPEDEAVAEPQVRGFRLHGGGCRASPPSAAPLT